MGLKVLIVDDSRRFLETARAVLVREGLDVVGAVSSTEQALSQAELLRPDVVLVDVHLGEESGFQLARELASVGRLAASTTIMMSTHDEADFTDLVEESPVAGFLPKAELSAHRIRSILSDHG